MTAFRTWDAGEDSFTIEQGRLLRVDLQGTPSTEANLLEAVIVSRERTFLPSDRAADPPTETPQPGFVNDVSVFFEVPDDVLGNGELLVGFSGESVITVPLAEVDPIVVTSLGPR